MCNIRIKLFSYVACAAAITVLCAVGFGQSTNQANPTPVISNEINGIIPARAIGDSRLTNHFYAFNGDQGDVFINIVTENLDGDIDIFTSDSLQALTKITVFSDNANSETGRIVYLRKPEKLLLRVQGRSPNDENATYRIKFAGSFQPLPRSLAEEVPLKPEVRVERPGDPIVNSVGTIIGVVPKPEPVPVPEVEQPAEKAKVNEKTINLISSDEGEKLESSARIEIRRESRTVDKDEVIETNKEKPTVAKPVLIITDDIEPVEAPTTEEKAAVEEKKEEASSPKTVVEPMSPEQLGKIQLVVSFKDGRVLKQAMNTVFSFNVNQGILTIVSNDGKTARFSLLEIEKISIE